MTEEAVYSAAQLEVAIEQAERQVSDAEYKLARARVWLAWLEAQKVPPGAAAANDTRPHDSNP